jgi:ketosteroid isomerase-like protein
MRKLLILSVAFVALAGCEHMHQMMAGGETAKPAAAPVVDTAADEAKLKALEDKFAADFNAKDIDAIMSHYSDDVLVFDIVPPRQYVGAAAYRKDWEDLLKPFKTLKFDITDYAVSSDGQMAWAHSMQHLTATQMAGKKTQKIDMTVRVTDVYKKINGDWKVVHEHVSVPIDLSKGKPDFTSKP